MEIMIPIYYILSTSSLIQNVFQLEKQHSTHKVNQKRFEDYSLGTGRAGEEVADNGCKIVHDSSSEPSEGRRLRVPRVLPQL